MFFVTTPRSSVLLVGALLLVLPRPPFGRSIDSFSEPSRSLELLDERVEADEEEADAVLEVLAPSLVFATFSRSPHRFILRAFAVSRITSWGSS